MLMNAILFIGAHPDDETFCAGTMAKYTRAGTRAAVVCGTRGERGATAGLCSIEELPKVREAELRRSMKVVGLRPEDLFFLPYEDQKLAKAPIDEVRRELVRIIREVKPEVVLTFDPYGGNEHTDHLAISRFASDAVAAAGDGRWYPETGGPHEVIRMLWYPPLALWKLPKEEDLVDQPAIDFLIDTEPWRAIKEAAIREHKTQLPGLRRLFFGGEFTGVNTTKEGFRLAWGPRPAKTPAGDLFED